MTKRIDKTVIEPLIRMAISDLNTAQTRIATIGSNLQNTPHRKATRLSTAQKRIAEAAAILREFADANEVGLRETMKT
jgi:hypothetical protein